MNQADALKRLEALEAQNRVTAIEQAFSDPEGRAMAEKVAREAGVNVEQLIAEYIEIAKHIAEVGEAAWEAECLAKDQKQAERMGVSLERYQSIDWHAEHNAWVAEGSVVGAWIGRDWNTWPARLVTPSR